MRVERREPRRVLPVLGRVGATAGGHGAARRDSAGDRREALLRVSARAAELRQRGQCVNAKRVLRLMREDNLLCLRTRRFAPVTTDSQHGWRVWPNLARGLVTRNLNELWVADITYVRLQEEFVYVAVVLDAHSRRVIGWAVAVHLGASVAVEALHMALAERKPRSGSDPSFRSRHSVRLRRLSHATGRAWCATEHESGGQSLRQRQSRVFHEDAQTRAGARQQLARSDALRHRPGSHFSRSPITIRGCILHWAI